MPIHLHFRAYDVHVGRQEPIEHEHSHLKELPLCVFDAIGILGLEEHEVTRTAYLLVVRVVLATGDQGSDCRARADGDNLHLWGDSWVLELAEVILALAIDDRPQGASIVCGDVSSQCESGCCIAYLTKDLRADV